MKDIPLFTTEYGIATLVLREISYRGEAYIRIQSTQQPQELVGECASFCRACGAERVYATGHDFLQNYPLHTAVVRMCCLRKCIPESEVALFPVVGELSGQWQAIYNEKMAQVANASYMTDREAQELPSKNDAYFVHRQGKLLGIGRASGEKLDVVISVEPGAGEEIVKALCSVLTEQTVTLEVATANIKAMRLYERLGFVAVEELSRWYQIF